MTPQNLMPLSQVFDVPRMEDLGGHAQLERTDEMTTGRRYIQYERILHSLHATAGRTSLPSMRAEEGHAFSP